MNPLIYRKRSPFSLYRQQSYVLLFSDRPLRVVKLHRKSEHIIECIDGERTISEISKRTRLGEDAIFEFCEYLRLRGILELSGVKPPSELPSVTVVIPVRDRWTDLFECLDSLFSLSYPLEKLDIIVVDDASKERVELPQRYPVRLLRNSSVRGQSFCRNLAVGYAKGHVLAFLDSDCVAGRSWLESLVPYVCFPAIGAVGGYVDGYYDQNIIDRYEKTFSPLLMGESPFFGGPDSSMAYIPFCNFLVRREVYVATGGLREGMRVGEDVDFCLRLRKAGYLLLYVPQGGVRHKHRRELAQMLRRRFEYGTSEATLYRLHREKTKSLQMLPGPSVAYIFVTLSLLFLSSSLLALAPVTFLLDLLGRRRRLKGYKELVTLKSLAFSVWRTYVSSFYFFSFYLLRYHLLLLVVAGLLHLPFLLYVIFLVLICASIDYHAKRPRLSFLAYLFCYGADHLSYQIGVLYGSLVERNLLAYRVRLIAKKPLPKFVSHRIGSQYTP